MSPNLRTDSMKSADLTDIRESLKEEEDEIVDKWE